MSTERIDFIDLAKGVCIILVVMGHCGICNSITGFEYVRIPFYYILSGLFFKNYGSFLNFLIKKTNKILIPFLFFYFLSYAIFYILRFFDCQEVIIWSHGIMDIFHQRHIFNDAIWFLLTLYWCNLLFAAITSIASKEYLRVGLVLLLGGLGLWLGQEQIILPLYLDIACTALPFYCFGYYLRKAPLLTKHRFDKFNIPLALSLYALCYYLAKQAPYRLEFYCNNIQNPLLGYPIALLGVLFLLISCKCIKKIPLVTTLGQYSLIILCTHQLINNPLRRLGQLEEYAILQEPWLRLSACLLSALVLIPLCLKYIPYFVAQKDLIRWQKSKVSK